MFGQDNVLIETPSSIELGIVIKEERKAEQQSIPVSEMILQRILLWRSTANIVRQAQQIQ